MCNMDLRIGQGEDIHVLAENRKLILGGVEIPYSLGLLGHSDADVVLHALSDSLLGALALGDIGKYFPPSDSSIEGIDSGLIVKKCLTLIKEKGYRVNNVDIMVFLEKPRLSSYIETMKERIATLLEVETERVSVKCGTNEKMDAVGEGKAIRATSIVLLIKE